MKKLIIIIASAMPLQAISGPDAPADSLARELQEIVVTARQPATTLAGTALISTIAGSALEHIGTALDLLGQLPMISVAADGAVSVTGKGTPEIYIDGRPVRSDDELKTLRSGNVGRVELELAPGAMYASDVKAVLKITTRHNFISGLSVTDRGEITARRKWSANDMLDINYRSRAWDFFASGIIARNNSLIKGTTVNTLTAGPGKGTVVGSSQRKSYPSVNAVVKAGFNHSAPGRSFGGYYRYNPERADFSNAGEEWLDDAPRIRREIRTGIRARSHRASVYYDVSFAPQHTLHFDGDFTASRSTDNALTSYPANSRADVASSTIRKSSLWAAQLYLSLPLAKGALTVGAAGSHTRSAIGFTMLNPEVGAYVPSLSTEAKQAKAAAFASFSRTFGNFSLRTGMRYEYTRYRFAEDQTARPDMSKTGGDLSPDIALSYSCSGNDAAQVSLSYRMTPVKPPYASLTGSITYTGIHELEGGNPALKDERLHDLQLFGMWRDFMLQADFTRSIDSYAFVKRIYPANSLQLIMLPVNINVSALDAYLIWTRPIAAWTPTVTLGLHKQWLTVAGTACNRPMLSYSLENTISLPKDLLITLNASGHTRGDLHTNRFGATWFTLDASATKTFLNKSLQLKLTATDIFNTRNNDWTMHTFGISVDKRQTYDLRGISLAVTYSFQPRKSTYKGRDAAASELNRL